MARRIPTSCGRGPNTSRRARGAWCSLEVERRMGGPMRGIVVVGIALIVLGVVALAWQGITYTSKEKVVDVGPLKVEAERQKTIPVSPVVGGVAVAAGLVLVVVGARRSRPPRRRSPRRPAGRRGFLDRQTTPSRRKRATAAALR